MFLSLLLKGTHCKFNDVVDEIAWDGLAIHFVDYHLLQKKKKKEKEDEDDKKCIYTAPKTSQ